MKTKLLISLMLLLVCVPAQATVWNYEGDCGIGLKYYGHNYRGEYLQNYTGSLTASFDDTTSVMVVEMLFDEITFTLLDHDFYDYEQPSSFDKMINVTFTKVINENSFGELPFDPIGITGDNEHNPVMLAVSFNDSINFDIFTYSGPRFHDASFVFAGGNGLYELSGNGNLTEVPEPMSLLLTSLGLLGLPVFSRRRS